MPACLRVNYGPSTIPTTLIVALDFSHATVAPAGLGAVYIFLDKFFEPYGHYQILIYTIIKDIGTIPTTLIVALDFFHVTVAPARSGRVYIFLDKFSEPYGHYQFYAQYQRYRHYHYYTNNCTRFFPCFAREKSSATVSVVVIVPKSLILGIELIVPIGFKEFI